MKLPPELHPYVGATWREIFAQVDELDSEGREQLAAALQEGLGRPDLEVGGLTELIWLAVGSQQPPAPYRYSEIPRRGIEVLEKLKLIQDRVLKLHVPLEGGDKLNSP